jgi:hypothetical protein
MVINAYHFFSRPSLNMLAIRSHSRPTKGLLGLTAGRLLGALDFVESSLIYMWVHWTESIKSCKAIVQRYMTRRERPYPSNKILQPVKQLLALWGSHYEYMEISTLAS